MLLALLLACSSEPGLDSTPDTEVATTDSEPRAPCDVVGFQIDGPSAPRVGDSWTILLTCDDALVTGAFRVAFTPPDFAELRNNVATFIQPGTAVLTGQVGTRRATMDVTVTD
jgi:hypothetical protein